MIQLVPQELLEEDAIPTPRVPAAVNRCVELATGDRNSTKSSTSISVTAPSTFAARYAAVYAKEKEHTTHVNDHVRGVISLHNLR